jgi:hypothetical protein
MLISQFSATSGQRIRRQMWYLSMGTVVDVFIWLGLLIAFHYADSYVVTMFLLPQTIYFLLYSYSIFNNSDFLKVIAIWLAQPVPANPWEFVRDSWRKPPESAGARKLAHLMTAALAVKVAITTLLIATFLIKDYRVLVLYAVYKLVVHLFGNRVSYWSDSEQVDPSFDHHHICERNQSWPACKACVPIDRTASKDLHITRHPRHQVRLSRSLAPLAPLASIAITASKRVSGTSNGDAASLTASACARVESDRVGEELPGGRNATGVIESVSVSTA